MNGLFKRHQYVFGSVGRAIVNDDNLGVAHIVANHARDRTRQDMALIEMGDDDGQVDRPSG
jgi:hypothetical protein